MTNFCCRKCGHPLAANAKFCTNCGEAQHVPCPNPGCMYHLLGHESFCPLCCTRLVPANCETCQHFRDAIPISTVLRVPTSVIDVAEAMSKIKEEEVKLRDEEAKIKVDLLKVDQVQWGFRPLMHSYCGESEEEGRYEIQELKNRDNNCSGYQPKLKNSPSDCGTCSYRDVPPDQYQARCRGVMDPKLHNECVNAMNKDRGLEVQSAWIHKGLLPRPPLFFDRCRAYSEGRQFAVCDFFNLRRCCPRYEQKDLN